MKYVRSKYTVWESFSTMTIVTGYSVSQRWYALEQDGTLKVHAGYSWDGATGALDTKDFVLASCIHDIFCEMVNLGLLPPHVQSLADEQMRLIQEAEGMPKWRQLYTYFFVRLYQINKKNKPQRKIYEIL